MMKPPRSSRIESGNLSRCCGESARNFVQGKRTKRRGVMQGEKLCFGKECVKKISSLGVFGATSFPARSESSWSGRILIKEKGNWTNGSGMG